MDAMPRIDRASLMTLEAYARERPEFRAKVMAHKKNRTVQLGEHLKLIFEDELTISKNRVSRRNSTLITRSFRTAATSRRP